MPRQRLAYERGILYVLDSNPLPVSPRLDAEFKEIGRDEADKLAAAMGTEDARTVLARFASGRRCFAAWAHGRLAAYGWVSRTAECIGEQEREIRMLPHDAYIWDCATLLEFRGKLLYSALLSHIVAVVRAEGVRRVWIGTALGNRVSLRGFLNAGFRPVLMLVYYRVFNMHAVLQIGHHTAPAELVADARRAVTMENERAWGPLVFGGSGPAHLPTCAELEA